MTGKKEIYLVPYAHLDTQWRWEYPTTIHKYIKETLSENFRLFEIYPGHCFNFTGAIRYSMMKDYYPEDFEKVKEYIAARRWHLAGTCLDETDVLVPSVESMIRNILYGDRWAKKEFGRSSRDYMIPDCFGFPANMPSVMAHCGIIGFSSQKLTWNSSVGIPFELGIWKGPDGSEIVSALNPGRYNSALFPGIPHNASRKKHLERLGRKNGIWKSFQYYGVGDIGGAPKEASVKRALAGIDHYQKKGGVMKVRQGAADRFFDEITDSERQRMDCYEGDFLLTNHSAGTITSAAIMKRWNRRNEQLAFAAEAAALMAFHESGMPYPKQKIQSAWWRIVGSQMHDILPGTSTPTAYEYSQNDELVALNTWNSILNDSAEALASHVPGRGDFLLFNPCDVERRDPVLIDLPEGLFQNAVSLRIVSADGDVIGGQVRTIQDGIRTAVFVPWLQPLGWARYSIESVSEQADCTDPVSLEEHTEYFILENARYCLRISRDGCIESVLEKERQKELLKAPLAYELQKECPAQFPAWNMDWRDRKKKPHRRIEGGGEVLILEQGPLRCTLQIRIEFQSSTFIKEVSLSSGSEIVEFTERINWRDSGFSLKLAVSGNLDRPELITNWETSRVSRDINHSRIFEFPSRYWIDLSDAEGGISILEDSKYGYDRPDSDTVRMTLLFTPGLRPVGLCRDQKSQDWGEHTIRYALYGHRGDWRGTDIHARCFNQPVQAFHLKEAVRGTGSADISATGGGGGSLSPFSVSNPQVGVLSVKKAEEGDGWLMRLYERYDKDTDTEIVFKDPVVSALQVNGLEEQMGELAVEGRRVRITLKANSILSCIINLEGNAVVHPVRQESLPLECNIRLAGRNGEPGKAIFPSELMPSRISSGAISFGITVGTGNNALSCDGQAIAIPQGYTSLSLLITADEDCEAAFDWYGPENRLLGTECRHIGSSTGFIGQWDKRVWKKKPKHFVDFKRDYFWFNKCTGVTPGYVNRERIEWYSTHTHKDGMDEAYRYGYLYSLILEIPSGAATLVLPRDSRIQIPAATASDRSIEVQSLRYLNDKYDF